MHFYLERYPLQVNGAPFPPEASVAHYRQLKSWLGIERTVIVQPNAYGFDNSCTLEGVAELGLANARAVVVVKPDVDDAELARLTKAGARGLRFMTLPSGALQWDVMDGLVPRVRAHGWHPIVQLDGRDLPHREAQLKRIEGDYIIDHTGKFLEPVPVDHDAFRTLLRLIDSGNCYVKLSAPYETSKAGPPDFDDVGILAKTLVRAAPERMLWASNWPHPSAAPGQYPDDAGLLDLLLEWAPDEAVQRKILVDNPARLYGF